MITTIPSSLFAERRLQFSKKMKRGAIAIFYSNDHMPRSGDQYYPFRQDSALYSMTGIDQPGTILVLYPDAKEKSWREILFILPNDPAHLIWNGERLSKSAASKISGVGNIHWMGRFEKIMPAIINSAPTIYTNVPANKNANSTYSLNERNTTALKSAYPKHKFLPAEPLLQKIVMIKHPVEIDLVKKAIHVTGLAFDRVLQSKPAGKKEYEIEAELTYVMRLNRCQHAFEPIVASGKAACTLHYISNHQTIKPGSLILLDYGAEFANMASDMTRTIPASGRFTPLQKNYYQAVLRVLKTISASMHPGTTLEELNKETARLIESELIGLKIFSARDVRRQDKKSPLWKKYFMHGVSHHLGYDVHDLSDRKAPLRPGMILTCEPGIYHREAGIGIRIENDILITKKGPQNLMASIPVEADEIENAMHPST